MQDVPRQVTSKEVFDDYYGGSIHTACLREVCKLVLDCCKEFGIPLSCFDISALTYQRFHPWFNNRMKIKDLKEKMQADLDAKTKPLPEKK